MPEHLHFRIITLTNVSVTQIASSKISINGKRISEGLQNITGQILKRICLFVINVLEAFSQWHNSDPRKDFDKNYNFGFVQKN